ncbi:hypothetical protein [Natronosalvus rutilus]|uniref:Uncharacterized protein n=1 Tax=Natronosalvus rutilus TaxID=2953753 RepID=A0A9E7ND35_9EURY|nr:hypothetical protein [Natronosalvus rutilus]UTF54724.1 hypothetical protein NGM29_05485 [Natronosalvus rutilus]
MSTVDRAVFAVAVLSLWILALALVGVALHGFELVPSDLPLSLTVSLMVLGGVLYLLALGFVNYYGGIDVRLF